jgi:hypothetical protein
VTQNNYGEIQKFRYTGIRYPDCLSGSFDPDCPDVQRICRLRFNPVRRHESEVSVLDNPGLAVG